MTAPSDDAEITALLARWRQGDRAAEAELLRSVYPVLQEIARARLRRTPQELTLGTTDLVHETYARLARADALDYQARGHFFAVAARSIRYFVIDHLRSRGSERHGGHTPFIALDQIAEEEPAIDSIDLDVDWLAVHAALDALEKVDAECAWIVELKFFGGLTTDEIAEVCGVSRATVVRSWRFARAWLADRLQAFR